MKIGVGSKNGTKIRAVEEIIRTSSIFDGAEIIPVDVEVDLYGHPKNLKETIEGAMERARQAFVGNDYGFGIEGGFLEVPHSKTGYMETAACAIFDGKEYHLGLSPSLEWPRAVVEIMIREGLDGSQAFRKAGFTDQEKIGTTKGMFHQLTHGRLERKDQNKLAVMMALVHLENPEYY